LGIPKGKYFSEKVTISNEIESTYHSGLQQYNWGYVPSSNQQHHS
jgi:hypothetical protein